MAYRVKNTGKSIGVSLLAGFGISWAITIVATLVITAALAKNQLQQESITPAAVVTILIASFVSAIVAGKMQSEKRLLVCLAGGGVYYVSLLGCNALFFEGQFAGLLGALLTTMGSSLVAGLLQTRQKRQRPSYLKRLPKM